MAIIQTTWQELWDRSARLSLELKPHLRPGTHSLLIPSLPTAQGLLLIFAAVHLEVDVIFDEKTACPADAEGIFSVTSKHLDTWLAFEESESTYGLFIQASAQTLVDIRKKFLSMSATFGTSGSTGESKWIKKSLPGLLLEVDQLKDLFAIKSGQQIISLVRPFHVYGFLHSFLLPLIHNCSTMFWSTQKALPHLSSEFPAQSDLVILVPAQWRFVTLIWRSTAVKTLVSSGAEFGPKRTEELKEFQGRYYRFFEIFGSTETGGIGYRQVDSDSSAFTLFQGVTIEAAEGGTSVFSPFLAPDTRTLTADRLESSDSGHFYHRGRIDRVFKYAGLRHSLDEIEKVLALINGNASVISYFIEDSKIAQGGTLYAWLETNDAISLDVKFIRQEFALRSRAPCPKTITLVKSFPRDSQGKIMLTHLLATIQAK